MTAYSEVADYDWLMGDEACGLLDELAEDRAPLHKAIARLRCRVSLERTHLLVEQAELRRRATAKFSQAHRMFFTRIGLEQATNEWVAAHKAARFAHQRAGSSPTPAVADLCCGIGGDLSALAGQGAALGIDHDPITALFAASNTGAVVLTADATQFDLDGIAAWHIDPDRRPTGRRTSSLQLCQPDLPAIDRLLAQVPHAAVKLAPATKVPDEWAARCELEWISRDRECRQLVAWHGNLAQTPGRRRATILPTACHSAPSSWPRGGLTLRTITGSPNHPIPIATQPDRYIFDIDPAVLAAQLKGRLAAEHDLSALAPGPTYLTGPRLIIDPALTCFEIADILPMQTRQLARHLRALAIGQLEIKKRGVDIDPEKLRRDLKLRGDNQATLLITRIAGRLTAILAYRVSLTSTPPLTSLLESKPSRPND